MPRAADAIIQPGNPGAAIPRKLRRQARERFLAGRLAETQYVRQLRQVAKHVGDIVRGMAPDGVIANVAELVATLNHYSDLLAPWAQSVAARMIGDVSKRDAQAWSQHGKLIGRALKKEIDSAPTGEAMRRILAEQVHYITSLPRDAAERVHKLTIEGLGNSARASEIAAEIMKSGELTKSRAMLIARTEVARTATALTMSRAQYVGSEAYVWRTSKDGDVRKSHKEMEGKVVKWDEIPTLSDGTKTHAGMIYNCRCFVEPILPDKI